MYAPTLSRGITVRPRALWVNEDIRKAKRSRRKAEKRWRATTVFSHDVTTAMLVSQNKETAAMLISQTKPLGANSTSIRSDETSAFRIPVRWSIYIINSVDRTKFLCTTPPPTQHHSFFRNYPLYISLGITFYFYANSFYFGLSKPISLIVTWVKTLYIIRIFSTFFITSPDGQTIYLQQKGSFKTCSSVT